MASSNPVAGKTVDGDALRVDIEQIIANRAMIQGSSGSGKSYLGRLLVEKAASLVPFFVIDLEGEFVTLREKIDLVIVGEGGEIAVDMRSAKLLARKLMELKLSAVIDLSDFKPQQRRSYVSEFLHAVMEVPKQFHHRRMILLDEAHLFAPETGHAESCASVIDVASRGRKRGLGLVALTQRLSKLNKDVAAELRNVFIGQTTLDLDVKRALDMLGFPQNLETKKALRGLEHQFYAMGPAVSIPGVSLFKADKVTTTHPDPTKRKSLTPAAPSRAIKKVLYEFDNLPAKAEAEITDLSAAKKKITELERELKAKPVAAPAKAVQVVDKAAVKAAADAARHECDEKWRVPFEAQSQEIEDYRTRFKKAKQILGMPDYPATTPPRKPSGTPQPLPPSAKLPVAKIVPASEHEPVRQRLLRPSANGDGKLPKGEEIMLKAAAQHPDGVTREYLTIMTGYKRSTRNAYLQRLHERGFMEVAAGNRVVATEEGIAALGGNFEPLPTGEKLAEHYLTTLPKGERDILALLLANPSGLTRDDLSDMTGYKRSTRNAYLHRLDTRRLVHSPAGDKIKAVRMLTEA